MYRSASELLPTHWIQSQLLTCDNKIVNRSADVWIPANTSNLIAVAKLRQQNSNAVSDLRNKISIVNFCSVSMQLQAMGVSQWDRCSRQSILESQLRIRLIWECARTAIVGNNSRSSTTECIGIPVRNFPFMSFSRESLLLVCFSSRLASRQTCLAKHVGRRKRRQNVWRKLQPLRATADARGEPWWRFVFLILVIPNSWCKCFFFFRASNTVQSHCDPG